METVIIRGAIRQKDDLGMSPDDAQTRLNLATAAWVEIRECGLDSERAVNLIESKMQEYWLKVEPRQIHKKPKKERSIIFGDPLQRPPLKETTESETCENRPIDNAVIGEFADVV